MCSMNRIAFFLFFGGVVFFSGCDDFRNPDQIPAYIYIDHPQKITQTSQGSASHRITEAYVYINDEFLGAYSFGKSYPFLNTGETRVTIFSGIRMNNLDDMPNIYNAYARYEQTMFLEPGRVDTIRPEVRYAPAADFIFAENFEGPHIFTDDLDGSEETFMNTTSEVVFEGNRSGVLSVSREFPIAEVGTEEIYVNITRGNRVFVELDFKGDCDLFVGMVGYDGINLPQRFYKLQLFPRQDWRKVYVELTDEVFELRKEGYQFTLMAIWSQVTGTEVQNAYIDNVKVIQF